eukprot:jgi/Picre1/35244/NNA_002706.t1
MGVLGQHLLIGDGDDVVVKRGEAIVPDGEVKKGPIVVCTRNDDLESIVEGTPADRREDLVFIQNGELQGMVERLNAYARSVSHFPTAVKEFPWRNGYFHGLSSTAAANGDADPCPLHSSLLKEVGAV